MAVYLNTNKNLENYKELYNEEYFVDKSKIISLINKKINTRSKYLLKNLYLEEQDKFLEFLMKLLKDKSYVALCYMTGILPIKKYSTGSDLNMFDEYTFLKDRIFDEYFGFTSEEVISLCEKNDEIEFSELENWYIQL